VRSGQPYHAFRNGVPRSSCNVEAGSKNRVAAVTVDAARLSRYAGALQLSRSQINWSHYMTRLFVRHNVADYRAWRKAYDDFDVERKKLGVIAHAVFQSIDDPMM
jgi:hypothetical protein